MNLSRLIPVLLLFPAVAPAVSREMQELMRDVALLQQQLKDMQQSQDEKFTRLTVMVQQTLDIATKANTSVAVLESGIRNTLRDEQKNVVPAVAGLGAKVDSMGSDVQALRASMEDVTSRLGKLQQQLADLNKAVQALQAPAAPPPPAGGASTGPASSGPPADLPPMSVLYDNARRDFLGGKYELALQGFNLYLKFYGTTEYAPNAQFYIGSIHFAQDDLESALQDFDAVLEKYSENNKTPDALLWKGRTLVKMGHPTQGAKEFQELVRRFPNHDLAAQAKAQLKALGLSPGPPASKSTTRKKRG